MSLKRIVESFDTNYIPLEEQTLDEVSETQHNLTKALFDKVHSLQKRNVTNIKTYEHELQKVIEKFFPDKSWWEVTVCNIFWSLFEKKDPEQTVIDIIKGLHREFKEDVDDAMMDVDNPNTISEASEAGDEISEYQKWVDYDMKKYGKISKDTLDRVHDAGFSIVKDQYDDYEVIADTDVDESMLEGIDDEDVEKEKLVIYKDSDSGYKITPKSNYGKRIINARKITHAKDFKSAQDVIDYYKKWFGSADDDFEIVDENINEADTKTIKRYSDVREPHAYWYFTTHGIGPGTQPKDLHVLATVDGQNEKGTEGTFVALDGVLNTSELKQFDMKEMSPKNIPDDIKDKIEKQLGESLKEDDEKDSKPQYTTDQAKMLDELAYLLSTEYGAIEWYDEAISKIKECGLSPEDEQALIQGVEEIRHDEEHHAFHLEKLAELVKNKISVAQVDKIHENKNLKEDFNKNQFTKLTADEKEMVEQAAEEAGVDAKGFEAYVVNTLRRLASKRDDEASQIKKPSDMSFDDWKALRDEIVVGSYYGRDYENSFGIDSKLVYACSDGYLEYLWELAEERGEDNIDELDTPEEFANYCYGIEFSDEDYHSDELDEIDNKYNDFRDELFNAEGIYDFAYSYASYLMKHLVGESCKKKGKKKLTEGTSNFWSNDNFPLLVFGDYDEIYDQVYDMTKEQLGDDFDGEVDDTTEFEQNWDTYFDYASLDEDEYDRLKQRISDFNHDMNADDRHDVYEEADVNVEIKPGYYEAYQIYVDDEKYLSDWQIEEINKFLEELKSEFGLSQFGVSYQFSNGETGYTKVNEGALTEDKMKYLYTFTDETSIPAYDEEDAMAKYDRLWKGREGTTRSWEEIDKVAQELYDKRDAEGFADFNDEELAQLWAHCQTLDCAYDDEVYDMIKRLPHEDKIFAKADEIYDGGIEESLKEAVDKNKFYELIIKTEGNPSVKDLVALGYSEGAATEIISRLASKDKNSVIASAKKLYQNESLTEGMLFKPMTKAEAKDFYNKIKSSEMDMKMKKIVLDDLNFFTDNFEKDYGKKKEDVKESLITEMALSDEEQKSVSSWADKANVDEYSLETFIKKYKDVSDEEHISDDTIGRMARVLSFTDYDKEELDEKKKCESIQKPRHIVNESDFDDIRIYMNTWANYNENGADLSKYGIESLADGWLTVDEALEFAEEHAEDEPFINDTDNVPFEVSEYDNAVSTLEALQRLQESNVDEDVVIAIIEATGDSIDEAIDIAESGDYYFYPNVDNDTDLAYAVIDEIGSLGDALGDRVTNYIDEDAMRRDYEYDVRNILYDDAKSEIAREEDIDEDEVTDEQIEEWVDNNFDSYMDSIIDDEISAAERGDIDLSNYFDYEAFGRDLRFDGYTYTDKGAILIL